MAEIQGLVRKLTSCWLNPRRIWWCRKGHAWCDSTGDRRANCDSPPDCCSSCRTHSASLDSGLGHWPSWYYRLFLFLGSSNVFLLCFGTQFSCHLFANRTPKRTVKLLAPKLCFRAAPRARESSLHTNTNHGLHTFACACVCVWESECACVCALWQLLFYVLQPSKVKFHTAIVYKIIINKGLGLIALGHGFQLVVSTHYTAVPLTKLNVCVALFSLVWDECHRAALLILVLCLFIQLAVVVTARFVDFFGSLA